jgi:hypothetical protein
MTNEKFMYKCDLCEQQYQQGPHRYEGHTLKLYGITICDSCWNGNHDGFSPHYDKILLEHLRKNNFLVPERNIHGWLPRE